jgi:RsfA family transcription factor
MTDQALLKYNWTPQQDIILTNTVLEYIATGETMKKAYQVASELMFGERTPDACDQRWNSALKKRVRRELERARELRAVLRSKNGDVALKASGVLDTAANRELFGHDVVDDSVRKREALGKSFEEIAADNAEEPDLHYGEHPDVYHEHYGEEFNVIGTVTGRFSSDNSNYSGVPRSEPTDKELYLNMVNAIDAVLDRALQQQDSDMLLQIEVEELRERVRQLNEENAMLWGRVTELESIEKKHIAFTKAFNAAYGEEAI